MGTSCEMINQGLFKVQDYLGIFYFGLLCMRGFEKQGYGFKGVGVFEERKPHSYSDPFGCLHSCSFIAASSWLFCTRSRENRCSYPPF